MTKEVVVTIKGLHAAGGEPGEELELITVGKYSRVDDLHVIEYEECPDEEGELIVQNRMLIGKDQVEINKSGGLMTQMVFKKDFKSVMQYRMPFGTFEMAMEATEVVIEESDKRIDVRLQYYIQTNGAETAHCNMKIGISSRV